MHCGVDRSLQTQMNRTIQMSDQKRSRVLQIAVIRRKLEGNLESNLKLENKLLCEFNSLN